VSSAMNIDQYPRLRRISLDSILQMPIHLRVRIS
jgi:hypothetical protein